MPHDASDLATYVNTWIELRRKDKTIATLFDQWILGKAAKQQKPRWSVIRDVFHWVE